jgi:hypothetical protein
LRYKYLILDTCHQVTLNLREEDVRIRGYFEKAKGVLKENVWEAPIKNEKGPVAALCD